MLLVLIIGKWTVERICQNCSFVDDGFWLTVSVLAVVVIKWKN